MAPENEDILVSVEAGVGRVTLNRPKAINSLTDAMVATLAKALDGWEHDDSVHTVLLTGAGERGLCAGGDVVAIYHDAQAGGAKTRAFWHDEYVLNAHIARYPKPYVAVMDGIVMGGGVGISAHAGVRVVTDTTKIGMPEVALGVLPGTGGTQRFARLVGKARAIELMATGSLFSFEDAHAMGLVSHVWGDAELSGRTFAQAVQDYAKQFTPPNKAAKAVGHIKRAVQSGLESGFHEGLALERELQQRLFESDDAKEGLKANLEKRKANFSGR